MLAFSQEALKSVHADVRDWALLVVETISDLAEGQHWTAALTLTGGVLEDPRITQQTAGVAQVRSPRRHNAHTYPYWLTHTHTQSYETVILPAVQSEQPLTRAAAVRVLGVYCTASIQQTVAQSRLFATVLNYDVPVVAHEVQRVLLDLCVLFGTAFAERLDEATLAELRSGPQLEGERHAVLARVLAPLAGGPTESVTADMIETLWTGKLSLHPHTHRARADGCGDRFGKAAAARPLI